MLLRVSRIITADVHSGHTLSRRALSQRARAGASLPACPTTNTSFRRVPSSPAQAGRRSPVRGPVAAIYSDELNRAPHQRIGGSTTLRLLRRPSMPAAAEDDSVQSADGDEQSAIAATRSQRIVAIAGLAVAAIVVTVFLSRQGFDLQQTAEAIQNAIKDHPTTGPLIFIAAYAIAAVVLIPGTCHCMRNILA